MKRSQLAQETIFTASLYGQNGQHLMLLLYFSNFLDHDPYFGKWAYITWVSLVLYQDRVLQILLVFNMLILSNDLSSHIYPFRKFICDLPKKKQKKQFL